MCRGGVTFLLTGNSEAGCRESSSNQEETKSEEGSTCTALLTTKIVDAWRVYVGRTHISSNFGGVNCCWSWISCAACMWSWRGCQAGGAIRKHHPMWGKALLCMSYDYWRAQTNQGGYTELLSIDQRHYFLLWWLVMVLVRTGSNCAVRLLFSCRGIVVALEAGCHVLVCCRNFV